MRHTTPGVLYLEPSDPRWEAMLEHPRATTFHHPAWLHLLRSTYGYRVFIAAVSDGAGGVAAGLPIAEVSSVLTGKRWVALPFSDHCCPLAEDEAALATLVDGLAAAYADGAIPRLMVRSHLSHEALQPESTCVLHTLPLAGDERAVWKGMHSMHRQNTRYAEKHGVQVFERDDLPALRAFYRLQTLTRHRQGVPVQPWRFFARLGSLLEEGLGFVLLAVHDDDLCAAGVFLHWRQTLMFKYAASDPAQLGLRPNNLLYAQAIHWSCEHGVRQIDLGKTEIDNEGLRTFKKRWGADETPLVYSRLGGRSSPEQPGARLSRVMQWTIRHAPAWVCRASGEILYRHFA